MPDHPVLEHLDRVLADSIMGFGSVEQAIRRKGFDHERAIASGVHRG